MKLVPLLGPTAPDSTLIYDWNGVGDAPPLPLTVTLLDETLRDGLQSPSVKNPSLPEKLAGLELMNELGIEYVNVGLPSASPRALSRKRWSCVARSRRAATRSGRYARAEPWLPTSRRSSRCRSARGSPSKPRCSSGSSPNPRGG